MKALFRKPIFRFLAALLILAVIACVLMVTRKKGGSTKQTVKVERKTIVDKALAVGSIEPLNEVSVKSKISGVVGKLFVHIGDYVKEGAPLLEVKPDPTPLELVQAKRAVEMRQISLEKLKRDMERNEELRKQNLISDNEYELLRRDYDEADLNYTIAVEQLELIEKGKVRIADRNIETVIKAPITGYVLEKSVNVGDPVVPLTSYQAGTELLKMADMAQLLFRGTVDEIDVGKIAEGMKTELQIGALPGAHVTGHVSLISLKARKEENTTLFPVEITVDETGGMVLRAGFSANASIIITKKDSVLAIPERVVTFRNDSAFVRVPEGDRVKEVAIQTGLSDAVLIEVLSGLAEGQAVLEKEIPKIQ